MQIAGIAQAAICLRFTPLWRIQSLPFKGASNDPSVVRIIAANVKMSNRAYGKLLQLVREHDPHIAAFMETDHKWLSALTSLKGAPPVCRQAAAKQFLRHGAALAAAAVRAEVRFLVMDEVPSIKAIVALPDGRKFRLYVVHPEPPIPFEDTLGRDGELVLMAREIKSDPLPAIVTGDLNDVAWSRPHGAFSA